MSRKRKGDELRLEKAKITRRKAYAKIKANPVLYELEKEKEKNRYRKRKQMKNLKSIDEKDLKEQKVQRKKWREAAKRYRQKKKEEQMEILKSPEFINIVSQEELNDEDVIPKKSVYHSKKQATNCDCNLKIQIIQMKELRKRIRLMRILRTQRAEIERLKRKISTHSDSKNKQQLIKSNEIRSEKPMGNKNTNETTNKLAKLLEIFYEEYSTGVVVGGKKELITKNEIHKQKRYLTRSLKVLYEEFVKQTEINIDYSTFCFFRPFWVLVPKNDNNICLCVVHENIELLIKTLHGMKIINEESSNQLLDKICCSKYSEKCLLRECLDCKFKNVNYNYFSNEHDIKYYKWVRIKNNLTSKNRPKTTTIIKNIEFLAKPLDLIKIFENDLTLFMKHCSKIHVQYLAMRELKECLTINEAIIHVYFSENCTLKSANEVQYMESDDSQRELCLHTAVIHTFDFQTSSIGKLSVCTISECLKNDAPAIWAHLTPLLENILEQNPFVDTLHFQSDSRSSQYRNKYMFYIIPKLSKDFQQISKVTWNYLETHENRNFDEIGAVIKRNADLYVNYGSDLNNFDKFVSALQKGVENIVVIPITEEDIKDKEKLVPNNLTNFRATLGVHQVLWKNCSDNLTFRNASCFKCDTDTICIHDRHMEFHKLSHFPEIINKIDMDGNGTHMTYIKTEDGAASSTNENKTLG